MATTASFDAIVIGTGQAGPSLAGRLAAEGDRVAVVERSRFGGTCVNTGCTPTKTLVASARAAHVARRAGDYGVSIEGDIHVDMGAVRARVRKVVKRSNEGVEKGMKSLDQVTVYEGHARFTGPRTVAIDDVTIEAKRIFINVGARPYVPPFSAVDRDDIWTSSDMMTIDTLPEHLLIIGGSYIGLEFAQIYRRFGSRVTLIERGPRLIGREDEDTSEAIREFLEDEGIEIHVGAECIDAAKKDYGIVVTLDCDGDTRELAGSNLLVATGRRPNTHDLGLKSAGVEVDEKGYIIVDDELRTSADGVYALGDCNGRGAFTHTSFNDYEIVAANLLDGETRKVSDRFVGYALFTDPPLGRVGMTEAQVRESGRKALMAKRPMSKVSRAVEKGETNGFMKALVDAETKEILGAAILGIGGDEAIHAVLNVMYARAPYTVIERSVPIHPCVAELLPTLFGDLAPLE